MLNIPPLTDSRVRTSIWVRSRTPEVFYEWALRWEGQVGIQELVVEGMKARLQLYCRINCKRCNDFTEDEINIKLSS